MRVALDTKNGTTIPTCLKKVYRNRSYFLIFDAKGAEQARFVLSKQAQRDTKAFLAKVSKKLGEVVEKAATRPRERF